MKEPLWYKVIDWVTRILIAIIVPIITVSIIYDKDIMEVVGVLLQLLKELLEKIL